MLHITITGQPTGRKALMYQKPKRKGGRKFVPTYRAYAESAPGVERFEFSVVRDSSHNVFNKKKPRDPCDVKGECPPSAEPYIGFVREDGRLGFRIQLFEAGREGMESLVGRGNVLRRHLQIHVGAAASHGCILVAGTRRWYYRQFVRHLRGMLSYPDIIRVTVLPR